MKVSRCAKIDQRGEDTEVSVEVQHTFRNQGRILKIALSEVVQEDLCLIF
jgi:hypothetical protein